MIDSALLATSRRLLDRARVISEVPAAREPDVRAAGQSAPGQGAPHARRSAHQHSSPPPGAWGFAVSTLSACGQLINLAIASGSDEQLREANQWCADELEAIQRGPRAGAESPARFAQRICSDYAGVQAPVVARQERTSVATVRNARIKAGRDARLGHRLPAR